MDNVIRDATNERKYFTLVPNIVLDIGLSPYAQLLYVHLKRVVGADLSGECFKSTRTLGRELGVSVGKISQAKQELASLGFIEIERRSNPHGGRPRHYITLTDIMPQNIAFYHPNRASSPSELGPTSPYELASSPSEQEEEPTEEEQHSGDDTSRELAQKLIALGVHQSQAKKWAKERSPRMVQGWIEYVRRNGHGLSNAPGFLVAKLRDGEKPPAMQMLEDDRQRYISGKYAHLIEH